MSNTGGNVKTGTLLKLPRGLQKATAIRQKAWCGLYMSVTCPTYFFLCYYAKECRALCFCFFVFMSATKMNTHDLYEFYDFNIEVVLKSVNNSL